MDVQWIWAMFLMIISPYIFTLISRTWKWATDKQCREPGWNGIIWVMLFETLDSIGLCFMAFVLLPNIDPIAVVLFSFNIAFTPGAIGLCCTPSTSRISVVNVIGFLLQLSSIGFASIYYALETRSKVNVLHPLLFVIITILVSCNWWQNPLNLGSNQKTDIVAKETSGVKATIKHIRGKMCNLVGETVNLLSKYRVIMSCWKIFITFCFPLILFGASCVEGEKCVQTLFGLNTNASIKSILGHAFLTSNSVFGSCHYNLPMIAAAVGIVCSGLCYRAVKIGFSIVAQIPCVAVPLALSPFVAVAALILIVRRDTCSDCDLPYPQWNNDTSASEHLTHSFYWMVIVSGICGYASFVLITLYIWKPRNVRLQTSLELFTKPLYSGIFLVQSMQLNIRRVEITECKDDVITDMNSADSLNEMNCVSKQTPRIYICATMWHETKPEMEKLIKSILHLDADHDQRKQFRKVVRDYNDFFTFEVHIMFDDAFSIREDPKRGHVLELNQYVRNLIEVVKETTKEENCLEQKIKTVYGGMLTWTLPFGSKMVAHLKDKSKIRARKRWSQVMYMYYILGYKMNIHAFMKAGDFDGFIQKVGTSEYKEKSENIFILALDGDVVFTPKAVEYLIDRMKRKTNIGAACGRIHPTGNGPMVWYQKFEYAMCHWLQKAAEDRLGGVLCSPGCFSLFRGSALMDDNVMKVYTTPASEAMEHVKCDQGEDRWLCTLLLQQGYMIEYVAASDAYTEAPGKFSEFFNQRRRWSPSTVANMLDLLLKWNHLVKTNPNISNGYMFYQAFQMVTSILTPGTILLLLVDALNVAFPGFPYWAALLLTLIPIVIFIVVALSLSCETQIKIGSVLGISYSLVMMITIVGLALHIADKGICSITTVYLIFVAGVFIISAVLHLQEISCIIHGPLFFIAIPTASLIMFIYALCNLNATSWGTRESSENSSMAKDKSLTGFVSSWLGARYLCCTSHSEEISRRLEQVESNLHHREKRNENSNSDHNIESENKDTTAETEMMAPDNSMSDEILQKRQGSRQFPKRRWTKDQMLKPAKKTQLEKDEKKFWKRMIRTYLYPLNLTEKQKETIDRDLTTLRNKWCLFFFLINAMFICVVFTLQQVASQTKTLSIQLPCITERENVQYVGPISFAFMVVFGIMLFLQFVCMLAHRFGTLIHICARTTIFGSDDPIEASKNLYQDLCKESPENPTSSLNQVTPIDKFRGAARKVIMRQTFAQRLEELSNFTKLKMKTINKSEVMKSIEKKFPKFSATSHRAIYRLFIKSSRKE